MTAQHRLRPQSPARHVLARRSLGRPLLAVVPATLLSLAALPDAAATPIPVPAPAPPGRTALALTTPLGHVGSPNQDEARPALSEVKLLMADHALHVGDGSDELRGLCERMIRFSDDDAALEVWNRFGAESIDSPARVYGLPATHAGPSWGTSTTSAHDLTRFLDIKRATEPDSPVLRWMTEAGAIAADGTHQNWGTAQFSDVAGTKWGWSDTGAPVHASASWGHLFTVAAITYGTPEDQTADVRGALPDVPLPVPDPNLLRPGS